jgi:hypothetical protein
MAYAQKLTAIEQQYEQIRRDIAQTEAAMSYYLDQRDTALGMMDFGLAEEYGGFALEQESRLTALQVMEVGFELKMDLVGSIRRMEKAEVSA